MNYGCVYSAPQLSSIFNKGDFSESQPSVVHANAIIDMTNLNLSGNLSVGNNASIQGFFNVSGPSTLEDVACNTLHVTNGSTLASVSCGTLNSGAINSGTSSATIGGTLGVTGASTLAAVTCGALNTGTINSGTSSATIGGALGVTGTSTLGKLTATGNASLAGVSCGSLVCGDLNTGVNSATIGNHLTVSGNTTLSATTCSGPLSATDTLNVTGASTLAAVSCGALNTGTSSATIGGTLNVSGLTTLGSFSSPPGLYYGGTTLSVGTVYPYPSSSDTDYVYLNSSPQPFWSDLLKTSYISDATNTTATNKYRISHTINYTKAPTSSFSSWLDFSGNHSIAMGYLANPPAFLFDTVTKNATIANNLTVNNTTTTALLQCGTGGTPTPVVYFGATPSPSGIFGVTLSSGSTSAVNPVAYYTKIGQTVTVNASIVGLFTGASTTTTTIRLDNILPYPLQSASLSFYPAFIPGSAWFDSAQNPQQVFLKIDSDGVSAYLYATDGTGSFFYPTTTNGVFGAYFAFTYISSI
jgi:hypothetical protein